MIGSRCCSQTVNVTQSLLSVNSNISRIITGLANRLYYSKDKGRGSSDKNPQIAGKQVEQWPKSDPPPQSWRCECPKDPQPPNYDPYRLKIPEVVVPPLPPSNAKDIQNEEAGQPLQNMEMNFQSDPPIGSHTWTRLQDLFQKTPFVHPDYWKDLPVKPVTTAVKEVLPKLGYHGQSKYKYAFHEPWRPLDRLTLLQQAEKAELEQLDEPSEGDVDSAKQTEKQTT